MPELLDAELIRRSLAGDASRRLAELTLLDVVPSTNTWLMEQGARDDDSYRVVLAEHQTAGRGRQAKRWFSPPRSGLCLSVGRAVEQATPNIASLTLAVGVAIIRALEELGVRDLGLKWPNDLYAGQAKLGGILTDARLSGARMHIVCGVGINIDLALAGLDDEELAQADYTVTDLQSHAEELPNRSRIAAAVISRLLTGMDRFVAEGLAPFRADWNRYDCLRGEPVRVEQPDGELRGTARGIDEHGALCLDTEDGRRHIYTGSVRREARP